MPRGRRPKGEYALSDAERQARYRARQLAQQTPPVLRYAGPRIGAAAPSAGAISSPNCSPCRPSMPPGPTVYPTTCATAPPPKRFRPSSISISTTSPRSSRPVVLAVTDQDKVGIFQAALLGKFQPALTRDLQDARARLRATGEAQASRKWVRAIKPSRIGLVRGLSSSRASASSAVARGAAIRGQGNRSAIPAGSDISGGMGFAPPFRAPETFGLARRLSVPPPLGPKPHAFQSVRRADLKS